MSHFSLDCSECGASHEPGMSTLSCSACGAPLLVAYRGDADASPAVRLPRWAGRPIPLPLHDIDRLVSLNEGRTACVELAATGRMLGLNQLFAKLEFLNPTGSFKDRGTAIMMSAAREHGVTEVVEDSSGNAGASVAAYAARAALRVLLFPGYRS